METAKILLNGENQKDNPWQRLFNSLNQFSDDFMENREQPTLEITNMFD